MGSGRAAGPDGAEAASAEAPLAADEAARLLVPFGGAARVLLAVSGGPDSVALLHLAAARAGALPPLAVASVDHGLRAGSRAVAEGVVSAAARLGLPGRVLCWAGAKPRTRIQERARLARYALLADEARRIGATHLATAHTLDDQAETVLFRLIRGSGLEGLAGMRAARERDGLVHLRPLLAVPKARLVASCRAEGWPFETDPANLDPRYARARLRRLLPLLAAEGLSAAGLVRLARRLGEADAAILHAARRVLDEAAVSADAYRMAPLAAAPAAVRRRALGLLLAGRAREGSPRLERLERLAEELAAAVAARRPLRRTLHGALLAYDGADRLTLAAEPARRPPSGKRD